MQAGRVGGMVINSIGMHIFDISPTRITRIAIIGMDDPNIQCLDHGTYNLLYITRSPGMAR